MRVLLVGDDARAHIVAEQLARSSELYCAMENRNPAMLQATEKAFISDFANVEVIGSWATKENIDMAFIINEKALVAGLADVLEEAGLKLASPKSDATIIGTNRIYQKGIIKSAGIPCPRSFFCKDEKEIANAIKELRAFVVKPAFKNSEFLARLDTSFKNGKELVSYAKKLIKLHGSVMIETIVEGEEFILQAFSDGKSLSVLPPVQVARNVLEGDSGQITNGLGSYSTGKLLPFMRQGDLESARAMLQRIINECSKRGIHYKGVLSGQFMLTKSGVILLNIENSMGNPESINTLSLLNTQFVEVLSSIADENLKGVSIRDHPTVVKYVVPEIYPQNPKMKQQIEIDEKQIWNSGSKYHINSLEGKGGKLYLTQSRSVAVYASGNTLDEAEQRAEAAANTIKGKVRHRSDIGTKAFIQKRIGHMNSVRGVREF